ncbi:MAG: ribonuclease R, partial [Bryobacteraceae bacterium]
MSDAALLEHIGKLPHARASFKQLVRELNAHGDAREALEDSLDRLTDRGDLVELKSGHFVATQSSREYVAGRLNLHRDGYGFVIPDKPVAGIQGDIYIPRDSARKAMHADRVVAHILRIEKDGRADGEILRVLRRAHPSVVGEFRIGRHGNFVIPHDERLHQWIEIAGGMEMPAAAENRDRVGA